MLSDRGDYEKTYDYAMSDQPESHDEFPTNHVPTENAVQMSRLWEHLYNHANEPVDIDSYDGDYRDDAPSYNMSVVVERGHHGTLRARVTWTIPRDDVMAATGDGDVAKCTINWARNTCNVDHSYPLCDVPNDHEYHIKGARSSEVRGFHRRLKRVRFYFTSLCRLGSSHKCRYTFTSVKTFN